MTILEKLNLSDKTRAAMLTSPETRARIKMLDAIEIQTAMAEAEQIRVRSWSWKDADGRHMLDVRYGNRRLEIKPGKTAIEIGDAGNLVPTLKLLADAVKASEPDKALLAAKSKRSKVSKAA